LRISDCGLRIADGESALRIPRSAIRSIRGFMKLTDVIRRPLITEKTSLLREDGRTIVFQVASGANKIEIKHAIEQLLGSKVESIRTSISHGKVKRQGRFSGRRSDWKKAYVKLREGAKMPEFLEGA
jgi:large subunit ribosomal protein L23